MTTCTPAQAREEAYLLGSSGLGISADMLQSLAHQVEALTADKARLDWLSASVGSHGFCHTGYGEYRHYALQTTGYNNVRETIDKAMKEIK